MPFQQNRYKNKVRSTNLFLMRHLGYTLMEYIDHCDWKEDLQLCRNLINDTLTDENKAYLKFKLKSLFHLRDRRTSEEYALDLILGWIIEDAISEIFNDNLQINTSLHSADRRTGKQAP